MIKYRKITIISVVTNTISSIVLAKRFDKFVDRYGNTSIQANCVLYHRRVQFSVLVILLLFCYYYYYHFASTMNGEKDEYNKTTLQQMELYVCVYAQTQN